jgi:hypothetical protein
MEFPEYLCFSHTIMRSKSITLIRKLLAPLVVALGFTAAIDGADPASELRAALRDLRENVPPARWPTTRYVSQYNAAPNEFDASAKVLSFVLNCVSRSAAIVTPDRVQGAEGRLLRFDLTAFGLSAAMWESLASDREPYWHITTRVRASGFTPEARRHKADGSLGDSQIVYTDGGWLDLAAAAELRTLTGSGAPLVRLDWFIAKAVTPPHYYLLAGVEKTLAQWYATLGIDRRTVVKLRANHGANLFTSGITRKPRRLSRFQGPLGGVWQTYDFLGDDPTRDPIRNPTFALEYDASEHIAAKANGLHLFALFNGRGERQDTAPDRIAKDTSDPHGDGILRPLISCVRCHVEDGLRPFASDQRRLLAGGVELLAERIEKIDELSSFYASPKLERGLARDREDYASAVARATGGLSTRQTADALAVVYRRYAYEPVDAERAKRELGAASLAPLAASSDPILLALFRGLAVQRNQFEASFAEAAVLIRK